ncbi:MAG: UdgX family uracil-DNA binding protein [Pseudomonadota bacterium]
MNQESLFGNHGPDSDVTVVSFASRFEDWQAAARQQLAAQRPPEQLWWHATAPDVSDISPPGAMRAQQPGHAAPRVPAAFLTSARAVACHRAADRWSLLYALLWRLTHGEPRLLQDSADPAVARLQRYRSAVARDVHKMKAFVRFKELSSSAGEPTRYVAWFEPEHHIVEYASGFFRRRFANMRWSILTPERCAHWDGAAELRFSPGVSRAQAPTSDRLDDAWRTYFASIFNPARVKERAMCSEMPQKYWHNLPEAALIGSLLQEADIRTAAMTGRTQDDLRLRCGPRPGAHDAGAAGTAESGAAPDGTPSAATLATLASTIARCDRCAWACHSTQAIPGEGPAQAQIMLIGEQPGDAEDLAGRPFVGPAGRLLDQALRDAGLDRRSLYLTNAVKHFKFRPSGRRRLHETPNAQDLFACSDWLNREIDLVAPQIIVCLGRSAAHSVLGNGIRIQRDRGKVLQQRGRTALVTTHPAHVLRSTGESCGSVRRSGPYQQLVADLRQARAMIAAAPTPSGSVLLP